MTFFGPSMTEKTVGEARARTYPDAQGGEAHRMEVSVARDEHGRGCHTARGGEGLRGLDGLRARLWWSLNGKERTGSLESRGTRGGDHGGDGSGGVTPGTRGGVGEA